MSMKHIKRNTLRAQYGKMKVKWKEVRDLQEKAIASGQDPKEFGGVLLGKIPTFKQYVESIRANERQVEKRGHGVDEETLDLDWE